MIVRTRWPWVSTVLAILLVINPLGVDLIAAAFFSGEALSRNIWGPIVLSATAGMALMILLEWRLDGQKSVHECVLSPAEAQELFMQLGDAIDPETDRLLLAWVAPYRAPQVQGTGRVDRLFADLLNLR